MYHQIGEIESAMITSPDGAIATEVTSAKDENLEETINPQSCPSDVTDMYLKKILGYQKVLFCQQKKIVKKLSCFSKLGPSSQQSEECASIYPSSKNIDSFGSSTSHNIKSSEILSSDKHSKLSKIPRPTTTCDVIKGDAVISIKGKKNMVLKAVKKEVSEYEKKSKGGVLRLDHNMKLRLAALECIIVEEMGAKRCSVATGRILLNRIEALRESSSTDEDIVLDNVVASLSKDSMPSDDNVHLYEYPDIFQEKKSARKMNELLEKEGEDEDGEDEGEDEESELHTEKSNLGLLMEDGSQGDDWIEELGTNVATAKTKVSKRSRLFNKFRRKKTEEEEVALADPSGRNDAWNIRKIIQIPALKSSSLIKTSLGEHFFIAPDSPLMIALAGGDDTNPDLKKPRVLIGKSKSQFVNEVLMLNEQVMEVMVDEDASEPVVPRVEMDRLCVVKFYALGLTAPITSQGYRCIQQILDPRVRVREGATYIRRVCMSIFGDLIPEWETKSKLNAILYQFCLGIGYEIPSFTVDDVGSPQLLVEVELEIKKRLPKVVAVLDSQGRFAAIANGHFESKEGGA